MVPFDPSAMPVVRGEALVIDGAEGIVRDARQTPSPHHDARPEGAAVDLVVLHGISLPPGRFGGPWVSRLFRGVLPSDGHPYFVGLGGLRVSSHLFIRRTGALEQFVPLARRAWHAGVSRFRGRDHCNDFSVGIELEGDDGTPYAPAQYERLLPLLRALMARYPAITPDRVVGHCHVAPGRKTDPGEAFDWRRVSRALAER